MSSTLTTNTRTTTPRIRADAFCWKIGHHRQPRAEPASLAVIRHSGLSNLGSAPTTRYLGTVLNGVVVTRSPREKQVTVMTGLSIVADGPGRYITWGVVQISTSNLIIIGSMVVLFVLALVVPFGSGQDSQTDQERRKR